MGFRGWGVISTERMHRSHGIMDCDRMQGRGYEWEGANISRTIVKFYELHPMRIMRAVHTLLGEKEHFFSVAAFFAAVHCKVIARTCTRTFRCKKMQHIFTRLWRGGSRGRDCKVAQVTKKSPLGCLHYIVYTMAAVILYNLRMANCKHIVLAFCRESRSCNITYTEKVR